MQNQEIINEELLRLLKKYEVSHVNIPLLPINIPFEEILYKLDTEKRLNISEIDELKRVGLFNLAKFATKLTQEGIEDYALLHYYHRFPRRKANRLLHPRNSQQQAFERLKLKYGVSYCHHTAVRSPLYQILQKIEKNTRVSSEDIVWLQSNGMLSKNILCVHHVMEARFYQQEYQRTRNLWNIVNASSHWRGAGNAENALQLTDEIKTNTIKNNKLKSALLTTRGGAFRDLHKLKQAEDCAQEALQSFPNTYQPYTLRGAICYDRGHYIQGDQWFEEAIKRGATPHDVDSEIRRVLKRTEGDERQKLRKYLLEKDPLRYKWVMEMNTSTTKKDAYKAGIRK